MTDAFDKAKVGDILLVNHDVLRERPGVVRVVERTSLGLRTTNGHTRLFVLPEDCLRIVGNIKDPT